jgi:hypothetical protein
MLRPFTGLDECLKAVKNPFEAEVERVVTVGVGGGLGHRPSKGGELVAMISEHVGDRDDDVLLGAASGARVLGVDAHLARQRCERVEPLGGGQAGIGENCGGCLHPACLVGPEGARQQDGFQAPAVAQVRSEQGVRPGPQARAPRLAGEIRGAAESPFDHESHQLGFAG